MPFDLVYGQSRVKIILTASLDRNRLAHAYLFHGQPGVGKDALGIAMAMSLNCTEGVMGGCGECASCKRILNLEHPNFHMVLPVPTRPKAMKEEKYNEILRERAIARVTNPYREVNYNPELSTLPVIGIDHVRAMKQEVILKIADGGFRIFLISHAELLTPSASNSLLKLLEEPPKRTILFLTASMQARMLKTIISRCQSIRFDPLSEEEIKSALIHRWQIPDERATFFARISGGSLKRGLDLAEQGYEERREKALVFLENCLSGDTIRKMNGMDELLKWGDKVEIQEILCVLQVWFRDLLQLNWGYPQNVMNVDRLDELNQFRDRWSTFDAEAGLQCIQQSVDFIEKNVYLSLIIYTLGTELQTCKRG